MMVVLPCCETREQFATWRRSRQHFVVMLHMTAFNKKKAPGI